MRSIEPPALHTLCHHLDVISLAADSVERRIILMGSVAVMDEAARAEVTKLSAGSVQWEPLLKIAAINGLSHLLFRNLRAIDTVPAEVREKLRRTYLANAARNTLLARDLHRVAAAFDEAGLRYVTYKGAAVSKLAYDDLAARDTSDVDILVDPARVRDAIAILERLGFASGFVMAPHEREFWIRTNCEMPYTDPKTRTTIDLHWAFNSEHSPFRLSAEEVLQRSVRIEIDRVAVATLSHTDNVVQLAVHGTKHMWDRLEWIASFAAVAGRPESDWDEIMKVAGTAGVVKQLALSVHLANHFYGMPAAPLEEHIARSARDLAVLTSFVDERLFHERGELGTTELARLQPLLYESRFTGYRAVLRSVFVPMISDHEAVRLPRMLAPLHWVIRPVRLMGKYLRRALSPGKG